MAFQDPYASDSRILKELEPKFDDRLERFWDGPAIEELLREVVGRTPADYRREFEIDGVLHIRVPDMIEFMNYVMWMKDQGKERDVVALDAPYPKAARWLAFYLRVTPYGPEVRNHPDRPLTGDEELDFSDALQAVNRGLEIDPEYSELLYEKWCVLNSMRDEAAAAAWCRDVVERRHFVDPRCLASLGMLHLSNVAWEARSALLRGEPVAPDTVAYLESLRERIRRWNGEQEDSTEMGMLDMHIDDLKSQALGDQAR